MHWELKKPKIAWFGVGSNTKKNQICPKLSNGGWQNIQITGKIPSSEAEAENWQICYV